MVPARSWPSGLIVLGFFYPQYVESLGDLPLIGDFIPASGRMVIMIVFTMMALGLNIVVGYAGLLDLGYVAFYAVGAYTAAGSPRSSSTRWTFHFGSVGISTDGAGIHISIWLVLIIAGRLTALVGHPDRPADAAPARRLPRDRDARLRRDHPAVRPQRRQRLRLRPHARHVRDQPDRLARLRRDRRVARPAAQLPAVVRARAVVLLDRARAPALHRLLLASGCATRGSAAPGSRSARTRRPRPRWACR